MSDPQRFAFLGRSLQGFAIFRIRPEDSSLLQVAHTDDEFWAMVLTKALNDYLSGTGINVEIPEENIDTL